MAAESIASPADHIAGVMTPQATRAPALPEGCEV